MDNIFKLPFTAKNGIVSEKKDALLQTVIVISSGILSSSAVATALKAWLDNRKTTLTIQIDGGKKSLVYEGHHLSEDAALIQTLVAKLHESTNVVLPVGTVTIDLTDDAQQEQATLEPGSHQELSTHDDCQEQLPPHPSSLLKRFLLVRRW
ncbi:MAG TPA: hypothetical protein VL485_05095 [Ktedonobacteraceae bacterium]|jgi:hypothetical protein|nr:hypothetical protein [Ktedonobacteraceae bacterium]